ncbi:lipase lipl-1-like [Panulirus ornatus]|uniref:lipase lipl-1-like n=1 Tax=Panulirus ornatus TaxID=150431 RepID=UPI003A883CC2
MRSRAVETLVVVTTLVSVALGASTPQVPKGNLLAGLLQKSRGLKSDHWGANLTTPELIAAFGYPVEVHHVTTEDGYILELHRIPHGISGPSGDRPVVYLEHCLLCSSADYIMNDPPEALAYILADSGYDVWLSNMRGNTYSRGHVSLTDDDFSFWQFSWDEMAYYDVPASIDYVLDATGAQDLYYTGWSMGTTVFWAMMSERPEYNQKIRAMAALAPVAYMDHAKGLFIELAKYSSDFDTIMTLLGLGEFLPSSALMDYFVETYCDIESVAVEVCHNFLFLVAGPDADELNEEYLPVILAHTPAGTSVHTVNHYGQILHKGVFGKYDYGVLGNMNHYGQTTPPLYNLSNVHAPVGLFWGNTDWLADPQDVAHLAAELPNVVLNYNVNKTEFNHMDFGWGIHANEYVYTYVLDLFSKY